MSGELHLVRVSLLDGGAEFIARDVHVGLEGGHALAGPVIDEALCIVGAGQFVHLREFGMGSFEIGRAGVDCGTGHESGVNAASSL